MTEEILSLRDLRFAYPDGEVVLDDVSLSVHRGDYVAVLGPNGGGKTTLMKCILGMLRPQGGAVQVFGGAPDAARARVGYVPQCVTAREAFPLSVLDAVLLGGVHGAGTVFSSGWRRTRETVQKARQALSMVGLEGVDTRRFCDLSGGQRQRVVVARALMGDPELLLLDEPTANIDPQGKFCFYEFLASLPNSITTIVVSHDLSITASPFSGIAIVNRTLRYTPGNTLSPDQLTMLYGTHEPNCPMGSFITSVSHLFPGLAGLHAPTAQPAEPRHGRQAVRVHAEPSAKTAPENPVELPEPAGQAEAGHSELTMQPQRTDRAGQSPQPGRDAGSPATAAPHSPDAPATGENA